MIVFKNLLIFIEVKKIFFLFLADYLILRQRYNLIFYYYYCTALTFKYNFIHVIAAAGAHIALDCIVATITLQSFEFVKIINVLPYDYSTYLY